MRCCSALSIDDDNRKRSEPTDDSLPFSVLATVLLRYHTASVNRRRNKRPVVRILQQMSPTPAVQSRKWRRQDLLPLWWRQNPPLYDPHGCGSRDGEGPLHSLGKATGVTLTRSSPEVGWTKLPETGSEGEPLVWKNLSR